MRPVRRYLIGTSGHPNYGDELITSAWLRHLAARFPDDEVVLDSPQAGGSEALLGHLHPRLRCVDTVFRVADEAGSHDPWQVSSFVRGAVRDHGAAPRWAAGLRLLEGADVVHVLGGGWVNALWPLNTAALAAASVLADAGRPAALTGAGLLPADPASAPLLRRLLRGFAVVDVRDAPSLALLEGLPSAQRSADDALLALAPDEPQPWAPPEGLPATMLCVQSDVVAETDLPALAALVQDQLERWDVRGEDLGVLECVPRVDRWVWDAVVAPHLPGARFFSLGEVLDHGFPARPGQRWLTTRYHPHLLAAVRGASGVAVDVAPDYYGHKHRALTELGSPFEVRSLRPGDVATAGRVDDAASPTGWDVTDLVEGKRRLAERVHPDAPRADATRPGAPGAEPGQRREPERGGALGSRLRSRR